MRNANAVPSFSKHKFSNISYCENRPFSSKVFQNSDILELISARSMIVLLPNDGR